MNCKYCGSPEGRESFLYESICVCDKCAWHQLLLEDIDILMGKDNEPNLIIGNL